MHDYKAVDAGISEAVVEQIPEREFQKSCFKPMVG
jgi:hypothetical protein